MKEKVILTHQISNKNLVRRFRIENLESELKRISDFGRGDVPAAPLRDLH